ncbi:helix-turn-helix transcriptional regulator [Mesorhizobium sp. LjRoot246]
MTQGELADLAGTTQAYVSKVESGRINPESATLYAIAAALDCEIVFVPRQALVQVRAIVSSSLDGERNPTVARQTDSAVDELFIPDADDDDDPQRPGR